MLSSGTTGGSVGEAPAASLRTCILIATARVKGGHSGVCLELQHWDGQKQVDPWSSLSSQPSRVCELHVQSETLSKIRWRAVRKMLTVKL